MGTFIIHKFKIKKICPPIIITQAEHLKISMPITNLKVVVQ